MRGSAARDMRREQAKKRQAEYDKLTLDQKIDKQLSLEFQGKQVKKLLAKKTEQEKK